MDCPNKAREFRIACMDFLEKPRESRMVLWKKTCEIPGKHHFSQKSGSPIPAWFAVGGWKIPPGRAVYADGSSSITQVCDYLFKSPGGELRITLPLPLPVLFPKIKMAIICGSMVKGSGWHWQQDTEERLQTSSNRCNHKNNLSCVEWRKFARSSKQKKRSNPLSQEKEERLRQHSSKKYRVRIASQHFWVHKGPAHLIHLFLLFSKWWYKFKTKHVVLHMLKGNFPRRRDERCKIEVSKENEERERRAQLSSGHKHAKKPTQMQSYLFLEMGFANLTFTSSIGGHQSWWCDYQSQWCYWQWCWDDWGHLPRACQYRICCRDHVARSD